MLAQSPTSNSGPLILFYNAFFGDYPDFSSFSASTSCQFTVDKTRLHEADAVIFHLPLLHEFSDALKYPGQLWIGWSMESRTHTSIRAHAHWMQHFDLLMSFEADADIRCTYYPKREQWQAAMVRPLQAKTQAHHTAMFQSAQKNTSKRNEFAAELMRHMPIDSYGRFLNNRTIEQPDRGGETKMELLGSYHFCLALENDLQADYVTEKFFQPLMAGCVPVYRGAPNVEAYAPGDHCYINARDFDSPRTLAAFLTDLAHDEAAYARYFEWRDKPLRQAFIDGMEAASEEVFLQLAERIERLLLEQPRSLTASKPHRPFGWSGLARSKLHQLRRWINA